MRDVARDQPRHRVRLVERQHMPGEHEQRAAAVGPPRQLRPVDLGVPLSDIGGHVAAGASAESPEPAR